MAIEASKTVEIDAPIERCYEIAADIEGAVEWQPTLLSVDVLERDGEGRAELVEVESDAKVRKVKARLRFSYDPPSGLSWEQEKGDAKSLHGEWIFEDLGDGRTRATYALESDPGRVLGMLLRGPVRDQVANMLTGGSAEGLKERAEAG